MRDQYVKSGDGFLLVYSITDHSSSHSVAAFHEQVIAARGERDKIIPQIPLVLVGNKVRLNSFFSVFLYVCLTTWAFNEQLIFARVKKGKLYHKFP